MTKESRYVEAARNKNSSYDKRLSTEKSSLDLKLKSRRVRLLSDEASVKDFLGEILSTDGCRIVSPTSPTGSNKNITNLRRNGNSRSLNEFDEKLKEMRKVREIERHKTSSFPSFPVSLTEYRIKRNLYRSKSEHNLLKECEKHNSVYQIIKEQKTVFPLYRRKTVAMDAYQRSLSGIEPRINLSSKQKSSQGDFFPTKEMFAPQGHSNSVLYDKLPRGQSKLPHIEIPYE